jgi:hypothetical protein
MPIEVEPKDVFEKVVFSRAIIDDEASMNDLTLLSGWDLRTFSSRKRIPLDELNATTSGIVDDETGPLVARFAHLANLDVA